MHGPELPVPGQTFGTPAAATGARAAPMPFGQAVPQSSVPPQPSPMTPQYWPPPAGMQVIGLQPGSPQTPGDAAARAGRGRLAAAAVEMPPQPSPIVPQKRDAPALQVSGTQLDATHRPEPLQVWPAAQPPQSSARPQPSPTLPQYLPDTCWQASGAQPAPLTQIRLRTSGRSGRRRSRAWRSSRCR